MYIMYRYTLVTLLILSLLLANILILFQPLVLKTWYQQVGESMQTEQATQLVSLLTQNAKKGIDQSSYEPYPAALELTKAESDHLHDVSGLLHKVKFIFAAVFILLSVLLTRTTHIQTIIKLTLLTYLLLCCLFFVLMAMGWEHVFVGFHQLFFPQGNWAFPAESTVIQLFPEVFWQKTFALILTMPVVELLLVYLVGQLARTGLTRLRFNNDKINR
jgi:integral membrane protein (TIGR01906 family)